MSKVSIIMPIYNVEQYLSKCLDSVVNQTYKNLQIICVYDKSPDKSGEILEAYAQTDSRIQIVYSKEKKGLSAARNLGYKYADGEYIYFLDSDDWIDSDYIEKMVEAIEYSQTEFVVNLNAVSEKDGTGIGNLYSRDYLESSNKGFLRTEEAVDSEPWAVWINLYKKSFIDKNKLSFLEDYICEDVFYHYLVYLKVDKLYVFEGPCYHYTLRDDSLSGATKNENIEALKMASYMYNYLYKEGLLERVNLKIFIPILSVEKSEENYNLIKSYLNTVKDYIIAKKNRYSEFDLFKIGMFLGTKDFSEYQQKYQVADIRVAYIRAKATKTLAFSI